MMMRMRQSGVRKLARPLASPHTSRARLFSSTGNAPLVDEAYCLALLEQLRERKLPPKAQVMELLKASEDQHRQLKSLVRVDFPPVAAGGGVSADTTNSNSNSNSIKEEAAGAKSKIMVIGDTHGQFYDVLNMLKNVTNLPSPHNKLIFNGDMVDRGAYSFQIVFSLLAFKLALPDSIHLLRGNHESISMTKSYGFAKEITLAYDPQVLGMFYRVFQSLPVCALINSEAFVLHGGIGKNNSNMSMREFEEIDRFCEPKFPSALSDCLWCDPKDDDDEEEKEMKKQERKSDAWDFSPSPRGAGYLFSAKATSTFLAKNNLKWLVRSHEVRQEGFSVQHHGQCITIFSAPNYCDRVGNKGAVLVFENKKDSLPYILQFAAVPHPLAKKPQNWNLRDFF